MFGQALSGGYRPDSPAATDIVVDVTGYIAAGSLFGTVVPGRLLDTRSGLNDLTVDGSFQG
ncbi:hypothetical protein, partial [Ilumatobacter sp.]|uniref:hypothetical protein n=1 Tax=Ilumatobacter sp. TaxID=1967498 RepID=UPI0030AB0273